VDDGSSDHTHQMISEAMRKNPRIRALRQTTSSGAAGARNAGASLARGEYLLFEDDDCSSNPTKIERLVEALEASPAAAYAYCRVRIRYADGSYAEAGTDGPWSISTSCALLRRRCFDSVGRFDSSLPRLQDFDLFTRLLQRFETVEVPEVLFEMTRDESGISSSSESLLMAGQILLRKYEGEGMPGAHRSAMHRRIGGQLLLAGFGEMGTAHYRASVRASKGSVRSWLGFVAALAGPGSYRVALRAASRLQSWRSRTRRE